MNLLNALGYASEKTADLGSSAEALLANIEQFKPELGKINRDKVKADRWKSCVFLFQLTNDEIPSLSLPSPAGGITSDLAGVVGQPSRMASSSIRGAGGEGLARSLIESFVFLAIELQGESWSRTDLAAIARELNRRFPMPAIVIFKHQLPSPSGRGAGGEGISLVVIDRRANLKDAAKDVIDSRITVIKDVRINNTHHAHLDILADLALENLGDKRRPTNFRELYDAWIEALSTQALNKRFYQELANWYFWALTQAQFPKDAPKDADGRDSLSLIRLITRIIFCWFLKEKGLLPDALFDQRIATLLGDYNPTESTYYKAILQNLFFATLNQEMDKRVFRKAGQNFMAHNLYRYRSLMKNPDEVLKLLAGIPFMNGGLFECLDKTLGTREKPTYVRIDGFSDRDDNPLKIPNELFFGDECIVDLSGAYGDNKFKSAKVAGLIHILDRYKFTVAENTPIEEEVALDPELLGKVFENLLAAYNPETGATARKQTGSFYTPREIVNYMVDESLIASLKTKLEATPVGRDSSRQEHSVGMNPDLQNTPDTESRLRHLFAYNDQPHQFSAAEVANLIEAIDHLKILDPACGSGAFPMGVLHKLVFVLGKLDPGNRLWKARQLAKASEIPDATVRERVMNDIEQTFGANELDYGRKLYLIENCIYGVDIQPIAVQITKLRFFISLVVEQKINPRADNLGIRPLPNLETKFVAANTLIGIVRPGQQLLRNLDIDIKEAELRNVRERHFLARTPTTKAKCREQDAALRAEIAELLKSDGWDTTTAKKLSAWDPYDQNVSAEFFDPEWMFGITMGFDVVVGNPPYVLLQAGNRDDAINAYFRKRFKVASYKLDLYHLFIEQGVNLLSKMGTISYITPSNFASNNYAVALRRFLLTETGLAKLVFFDDGVFDASVHNLVFVAHNYMHRDAVTSFYKAAIEDVHLMVESKSSQLQSDLVDDMCLLVLHSASAAHGVIAKMNNAGTTFGAAATINFGMQLRDRSEYPNDVVESPKSKSILSKFHRECYAGKDVRRYSVTFSNRYCFFSREAKRGGCWDEDVHNAKGKILVRQIGAYPDGGIDTSGFAVLNAAFMILPKDRNLDLRFLLGVLNSSAIRFYWLNKFRDDRKTFPKIKGEYLKLLPLPKVENIKQAPIIRLVGEVEAAKQNDHNADTSAIEREIDEHVYRLYGLTPEEIKIVEESASSSSPRKQATQEIESEP